MWEFNDGYPLCIAYIENGSTSSGFVWPMIWTMDKYTYYISIAFIKDDNINQFQRVENCNVRIWYIPYQ